MENTVHFYQHNSPEFKHMLSGIKRMSNQLRFSPEGPIPMKRSQLLNLTRVLREECAAYQETHKDLTKLGKNQTERLKIAGQLRLLGNQLFTGKNVKTDLESRRDMLALKLVQAEAVKKGGVEGTQLLADDGKREERLREMKASPAFQAIVNSDAARRGGADYLLSLLKTKGGKLLAAYHVEERRLAERAANPQRNEQPQKPHVQKQQEQKNLGGSMLK